MSPLERRASQCLAREGMMPPGVLGRLSCARASLATHVASRISGYGGDGEAQDKVDERDEEMPREAVELR